MCTSTAHVEAKAAETRCAKRTNKTKDLPPTREELDAEMDRYNKETQAMWQRLAEPIDMPSTEEDLNEGKGAYFEDAEGRAESEDEV